MILFFVLFGLLWAFPVYADDATFDVYYTEPTTNADGSDLIDLKHVRAVFTKTDLTSWAADQTILASVPWGGGRQNFTVTLTYPNGGNETGTITLYAVDVNDEESPVGYSTPITASLASTIGDPGEVTAIGACSP